LKGGEKYGRRKKAGVISGYNKRPVWQWIGLYVVIAILVYGVIYYFF
jgi:hypothetical protein